MNNPILFRHIFNRHPNSTFYSAVTVLKIGSFHFLSIIYSKSSISIISKRYCSLQIVTFSWDQKSGDFFFKLWFAYPRAGGSAGREKVLWVECSMCGHRRECGSPSRPISALESELSWEKLLAQLPRTQSTTKIHHFQKFELFISNYEISAEISVWINSSIWKTSSLPT